MTIIIREQFIAEELIREHVRRRISLKIRQQNLGENRLRGVIRKLLETEAGSDEPSTYTGINVLADLLEKIIPIVEDDFKMLTTSPDMFCGNVIVLYTQYVKFGLFLIRF